MKKEKCCYITYLHGILCENDAISCTCMAYGILTVLSFTFQDLAFVLRALHALHFKPSPADLSVYTASAAEGANRAGLHEEDLGRVLGESLLCAGRHQGEGSPLKMRFSVM